jgi:hypothetical protein
MDLKHPVGSLLAGLAVLAGLWAYRALVPAAIKGGRGTLG